MSKRLIGTGLTIAFLFLVLIIVGVGYLGLKTTEDLRADAQSIATIQWRNVELVDEALTYSNRNARINTAILVMGNSPEIDALLKRRTENSRNISAILAVLQARAGSDRERNLLNAVIALRGSYVASYKNATVLLQQNRSTEARQILINESLPLLAKYHEAWSDLARFQTDEMNQHLVRSSAHHETARKRTLSLLALAVVLACGIAVFVVLKILAEIRNREQAEEHIQQLNQDLELKVQRRTAELEKSNQKLIAEIAERIAAEEQLRSKTAFLEAQTNSTVDGILVVDAAGRKILQNRRFKEIFQLPPETDKDDHSKAILDHVVTKTANPQQFLQRVKFLYLHKDQTEREEVEFKNGMVLDRYSAPVTGEDKTYYGRIWVFRDVTERKRSEEVVRRLSLAVEQSPASVVITDLQGKIIYVNRKFSECTGYSCEEAIGQNPRILKSGHTPTEEYKRLWETISSGQQWKGEFQNRRKDGGLYWEYAVIQPITDEKGQISHFMALKEDITERRHLQAQLQRAQKLEAIGQLAAGIAHEINTPMQFIGDNMRFVQQSWPPFGELASAFLSASEAVARDSKLQEIKDRLEALGAVDLKYRQTEIPKAIEQSLNGIERVSRIVQAMNQFSHPGGEGKEPTDINQAIETTVTVARNEWKFVAEMQTELSPDVGLIPCHQSEVNQVILNLLINAAQAIAEVVGDGSQRKGSITIRTVREPEAVQISVHDTGCGIPQAVQPRIFDPFFTTKEVGKGTGQGLALAHAIIVRKHGGNIWFETEVGKGTTFFVRLPTHAEDSRPMAKGASASAPADQT